MIASNFTFSFSTLPLAHYRVLYATNLFDMLWQTLTNNIPGTGPRSGDRRRYRPFSRPLLPRPNTALTSPAEAAGQNSMMLLLLAAGHAQHDNPMMRNFSFKSLAKDAQVRLPPNITQLPLAVQSQLLKL